MEVVERSLTMRLWIFPVLRAGNLDALSEGSRKSPSEMKKGESPRRAQEHESRRILQDAKLSNKYYYSILICSANYFDCC